MENNCFVNNVSQVIMNYVPLNYIDWNHLVDAVYKIQMSMEFISYKYEEF